MARKWAFCCKGSHLDTLWYLRFATLKRTVNRSKNGIPSSTHSPSFKSSSVLSPLFLPWVFLLISVIIHYWIHPTFTGCLRPHAVLPVFKMQVGRLTTGRRTAVGPQGGRRRLRRSSCSLCENGGRRLQAVEVSAHSGTCPLPRPWYNTEPAGGHHP